MKKRILFFLNTMEGGGAERVLANLLNVLDYEKYDITVATVRGGENLYRLPPAVKVKQLVKSKSFLSTLYIKILYNIPRRLFASLFLKGEYDIEIAYLPGFPTQVIAAKKSSANTKKIAFIHGKITEDTVTDLRYKDVASCLTEYRSLSKVCFVSSDAKNTFETTVGTLENSMVLYNVINCDEIRALAKEPNDISYKTNGTKLIAVGRLTEIKGFDRLLKAVNSLKDKYDFELWILGQGHLQDELDDYIKKNGLDNVHLLGYHDNPYSFIQQADYFVCSSHSEGYSTATVESLVLGVPVVTTDCPGMREILQDGKYGYIVENSTDGIKNGLECILSGNNQNIVNNAKECLTKSDINDALRSYLELFDNI